MELRYSEHARPRVRRCVEYAACFIRWFGQASSKVELSGSREDFSKRKSGRCWSCPSLLHGSPLPQRYIDVRQAHRSVSRFLRVQVLYNELGLKPWLHEWLVVLWVRSHLVSHEPVPVGRPDLYCNTPGYFWLTCVASTHGKDLQPVLRSQHSSSEPSRHGLLSSWTTTTKLCIPSNSFSREMDLIIAWTAQEYGGTGPDRRMDEV